MLPILPILVAIVWLLLIAPLAKSWKGKKKTFVYFMHAFSIIAVILCFGGAAICDADNGRLYDVNLSTSTCEGEYINGRTNVIAADGHVIKITTSCLSFKPKYEFYKWIFPVNRNGKQTGKTVITMEKK